MPLEKVLLFLTVEITVIIAASRLLGLVFRQLQQPQVIGEIVAGILLGPSLLGWVAPEIAALLFPPQVLPSLKVLSEYGVLFFMFLVGLELDPMLLRGRGRAAVVISHVSIIAPFFLGALLALFLYTRLSSDAVPFTSFALFLGAAMSITAFPVLARILIEHDLQKTKVGAVTLTCAAVDDVTAWCLLAFVVAIVRAAGLHQALVTVGLALLYITAMIFLVRPLLGRFAQLYEHSGRLSQNLVAAVFVLVLTSAAVTVLIGIHAIFGAFMLGAMMPKEGDFVRELTEKVEDFAVVFLLPIYFAYTGLRTQVGLLDSLDLWLFCVLIIGVATLGKFGGSAMAARITGLGWREANALGVLMNTRGLMELIILNIGLDLGVISPTLFAMMVLMAIFTTIMTTPVLAVIYPLERLRAELLEPEAEAAGMPVLVPVALASSGPALVDMAAALAEGDTPRIYALHLARPLERGTLGARVLQVPPAEHEALVPLLVHAQARGITIHPLVLVSRTPGVDICDVARAKGAQLILMGWHKPVFNQTVLGGTVQQVMKSSAADVAVFIDKDGLFPPRRILLPYTGTAHDRAALILAARLARRWGAQVTVLHVVRPGRPQPRIAQEARHVLDQEWPEPAGGSSRLVVLESPHPVETVLQEAARYDLTVLGVGEEWQLAPHVFGLRPERIAARCPSSLLIVRSRGQPVLQRSPGTLSWVRFWGTPTTSAAGAAQSSIVAR
ncbi:MAG: cation:proton antiporter [Deltaproteobacteria bacterium]|nr:cation:proton antiporter [Deltaproteobacteria bacterium]